MDQPANKTETVEMRDPAKVMRLARLGSFHQSRLSFMRILLRRLKAEDWRFERRLFDIDTNGVGVAVYTAHGPQNSYSLIAFAHDLPAEKRSDRVIAEAWDATFTLFDGIPDAADIVRLAQNVPLQEAGRVSEKELSVSRANRSVRLWAHVVDRLSSGQQPDETMISEIGYLMRTTAVYGSGKLGAADREVIADRPEFTAPFQAEMLSVYLTRAFVRDLVEHMAIAKGGETAVPMAPQIASRLGIGNSTGLGMAPFLLNHPRLFNNWIVAREAALARVRSVTVVTAQDVERFKTLFMRAAVMVDQWHSEHPLQIARLADLRRDIGLLRQRLDGDLSTGPQPWNQLFLWAEDALSLEGQEFLASLLLEMYPELVDGLADCMSDPHGRALIDGTATIGAFRALIAQHYGWAQDIDWNQRENIARAWYVSAEKLEPRLGERFDEPVADYEQPLAPARDAMALQAALTEFDVSDQIAPFLLRYPEHRHTVRRLQTLASAPYGEIHDNTISAAVMPIDMLRCKLSFFGAVHFDPRSDRWVRICMFANAPYPEDLANGDADLWVYPQIGASA